jgi:ZIP family zinc transporter
VTAVLLGLAVAGSLIGGAVIGGFTRLPERAAAAVTAFGGGILFAAVALELVPEADERAGLGSTAVGFLAGALAYVAADAWLARKEGMDSMRRASHAVAAGQPRLMKPSHAEAARGESIAAGLVVDGIPESFALGLTAAEGNVGLALLVGIAIGNVTEAYGAAQPIVAGGHPRRFALGLLTSIAIVLGGATVLGGTALADVGDSIVGVSEAVAAGAVLAVVLISVAPYAFKEVSRWAALASALGFVVGYLLS